MNTMYTICQINRNNINHIASFRDVNIANEIKVVLELKDDECEYFLSEVMFEK